MRSRIFFVPLMMAAAAAAGSQPGPSGAVTGFNYGNASLSADATGPFRAFPALEAVATIPSNTDPFAAETVGASCWVDAENGNRGQKNTKGTYHSELRLFDNRTGEYETFFLASGKFKTGSDGSALFGFDIPTSLFADGFESGDVSAWTYTTAASSNRKKGDRLRLACLLQGHSGHPAAEASSRSAVRFSPAPSGESQVHADETNRVRDLPPLETVFPVPATLDTGAHKTLVATCTVDLHDDGKPVKNAKGTYRSEVRVFDNRTGRYETFPGASKKFKTGDNGGFFFDVVIPTSNFADGLETGDLSAWSYIRSGFSNRKKATFARQVCGFYQLGS